MILSNQKKKNVSFEEVLEASLDQFLEKKDPVQKAERAKEKILVSRPKSGGIVTVAQRIPIPAAIRHQVFKRDLGKCAYKRSDGMKCSAQHFIEIHHRTEVSKGGQNSLENLITLCSAHHAHYHSSSNYINIRHERSSRAPIKVPMEPSFACKLRL